ncbi:hypothetical protein IWX75_001540 [Arthrobacter sp. CAN_A6]
MNQIIHDRPGQLQMIVDGLLQGEQVIAVYDSAATRKPGMPTTSSCGTC